jgi:hypothetical protein
MRATERTEIVRLKESLRFDILGGLQREQSGGTVVGLPTAKIEIYKRSGEPVLQLHIDFNWGNRVGTFNGGTWNWISSSSEVSLTIINATSRRLTWTVTLPAGEYRVLYIDSGEWWNSSGTEYRQIDWYDFGNTTPQPPPNWIEWYLYTAVDPVATVSSSVSRVTRGSPIDFSLNATNARSSGQQFRGGGLTVNDPVTPLRVFPSLVGQIAYTYSVRGYFVLSWRLARTVDTAVIIYPDSTRQDVLNRTVIGVNGPGKYPRRLI